MNFLPFISTFILVAAAELGDKTQLLTLGYASRFPVMTVISAVSSATALLMAIAVFGGNVISALIPEFYLRLGAGVFFVIFGLILLFGREREEKEDINAQKRISVFFMIFFAFFLAELGDKTQLLTLALSARYADPVQVWLGATMGMVAVNILAVWAGIFLKQRIPERAVKIVGGLLFIIFGIFSLGTLKYAFFCFKP